MSVLDDRIPSVDGCTIGRPSPSTRRADVDATFRRTMGALRALDPDAPRVYAVADMADQGKRRWWPLATGAPSGRFAALHRRALDDHPDPARAVEQVAAALVHAIVGRVAAAFVLGGAVWDPGPENLWIHLDSDVGIDWVGVRDPVLRSANLVGERDPMRRRNGRPESRQPGTVSMPCPAALAAWTAHRCARSLDVLLDGLAGLGPLDRTSVALMVGESVLGASTRVPMSGGATPDERWRRGQVLLDAFVREGWRVRARRIPGQTGPIRQGYPLC